MDVPSNVTDEVAKHKIKDSVFNNLFKDKKYLFQLYKALHPEDTNATEEQLTYHNNLHGVRILLSEYCCI